MKIFLGLLFVASSLARPEIGIESSRDINAQQLTPYLSAAHLPFVASSKAPVWVYFPDYNAYLVPAEALYPTESIIAKRTRPMANLIKLLQQRRTNKNPSDVQQGSNANTENNNSNPKPTTTLKPPINEPDNDNSTSTTQQEEIRPTVKPQQDKSSENKGYTFGQIFQRPENQGWPASPNRPTFQLNRPLISSYLPPGLVGWRPFSNLFQQQSETPRDHYVQYTTKSIPLHTQNYYYDGFSPRIPNYADEIQDFVSHIQESVLKETSTDSVDTSMMLATVPIGKNKPTSLLLRPVAKAVAGANGVAYASPVAKAVLRKGENVNIDYDPDAVAVAGPGGQAHAHPKLIVSYTNDTKPHIQ
ncbi:hypothetical protein O3M35_000951 [Rhynocoris fuscipes]|uniref:DUF4774 domain-containing protein n=1 Tax=Rhynocoris fuscipes TaxID=488301 RepID=A0AAW1DNK4_9HEMI